MASFGKQWLSVVVLLSLVALSYQVLTCYECASSVGKCPNQVARVCPDGQVCGTARLTNNGVTSVGKGCTTKDACAKGGNALVKDLVKTDKSRSPAPVIITCESCAADLCNKS